MHVINWFSQLTYLLKLNDANSQYFSIFQFLEECMDCCGQRFAQEICKFRFLNEMIRLVSKQHDGDKTPKEIQTKILDIMFTWTTKYPNESKIKEAYDMLKTQGIVHEPTKNVMIGNPEPLAPSRMVGRNTPLDPRHVMLKKLINSKNKDDIQKANLLIQNMCREDERRLQIKGRRLTELKKANESITVLKEMLENYDARVPSADDLQIINELHDTCELFQPTMLKLIAETEEKDETLGEILEVNDKLVAVLDKYRRKVVLGEDVPSTASAPKTADLLQDILGLEKPVSNTSTDVMDVLGDIFAKPERDVSSSAGAAVTASNEILVPQKLKTEVPAPVAPVLQKIDSKYDVLLGLAKTAPPSTAGLSRVNPVTAPAAPKRFGLDLDSLVDGMKTKLLPQVSTEDVDKINIADTDADGDDDEAMLLNDPVNLPIRTTSISSDTVLLVQSNGDKKQPSVEPAVENSKKDIKSLAEIHIDLDSIQPSSQPPRIILDEDKGLKIRLDFAKDRPRDDVLVVVISIINHSAQAVNNFQFEASVSKPCKLRLLPASAAKLPPVKPFRPPADSIFQILLIANPTQQTIPKITCIFSYCLGDDPDPIKESVEVKDVPYKVE